MEFEVAGLNVGYGLALDFLVEGVIQAFESVNRAIGGILHR